MVKFKLPKNLTPEPQPGADRLVQEPDGTITRIYASGARQSINPALPGSLSAAGAAAALSKGIDLSKIDSDVRKLLESYGPEQQRDDNIRLQKIYNEDIRRAAAEEGFVLDPEQQAILRAEERGQIITTPDELYAFDPTLERQQTQEGSLDFLNRRDDLRQAFESAAKSGGYNTTNLDSWIARAERTGLEEALAGYAKANPGVGGLRTRAFDQISGITAGRALADVPMTPVTTVGLPGALPQFNARDVYGQGFIRPQAPVQRPIYPQAQMGVPPAPPLINPNVARPTLNPQTAYVTQAPLLVEPGARPTLDAQTVYIGDGVPAQMRAGGAVGYQEGGMTQYSPDELGSTFDVSEYIDPETGRFYVNEFQRDVVFNPQLREAERMAGRLTPEEEMLNYEQMLGRLRVPGTYRTPRNMAEGGLASVAQQVAAEGRRGDSTLVHMTNDEVAGLQALAQQMGGSLTINPETGLPEANFLKKALPFIAAIAAPYLAPVAATLGISAPLLVGGLAAAGSVLGGGSLGEGLKMGLTAGTGAYLTSGASGTGGMMGENPLGVGGESTFNVANTFGARTAVDPALGGVDVTGGSGIQGVQLSPELQAPVAQAALTPPPTVPAATAKAAADGTKILGMDPSTLALLGIAGYGGSEASKEQDFYRQQQEKQEEELRRRRQLGYDAYDRSGLASIPMNIPTVTGAGGGIVAMAGGGMTYMEAGGTTGPTGLPRDVTGTGDGMSDSVPATIEGVQEARLADGEFVIPADVVADIGNGSSDAGSKKLYDMMDRIRNARHGTTDQPPEINAEKLMPA